MAKPLSVAVLSAIGLKKNMHMYLVRLGLKLPYSKACVKWQLSKKDRKLVFKTNYRLMQVKSIAECSKGSILQYFRPSLSYYLSLRSFCLFLSGHLTQVFLCIVFVKSKGSGWTARSPACLSICYSHLR